MTLSYSSQAFDKARRVRPVRRSWPARDKLTSIGITLAIHVVIGVLALTAVHVARPRVMQELSVQITPRKMEVVKDIAPPPRMTIPAAISAPLPEVTIQTVTPPPALVQQAVASPAPTQPVAASAVGETRDSYLGRLLAQLNRFKQYPRAARAAHIEGVVMLHFVMDAQGRVLRFEIAKSSGRPVLDAEALALIQRAQPLPALPAGFPTPTLDAVVPIAFSLGG